MHTDRALTLTEIYAAQPRWPHLRREIALDRLDLLHARLSGAQVRGDWAACEPLRAQVRAAGDVYGVLDREAQPVPRYGCARPWIAVDNSAEHDRLERERVAAHSAQMLERGLSKDARAELAARERAAIDALRALRIVREVRIYDWSVTLWLLAPGEPFGYDATAVHDRAEEIEEPRPRFDYAQAAAWAGELCRYRV
jgi:hypothetical protein